MDKIVNLHRQALGQVPSLMLPEIIVNLLTGKVKGPWVGGADELSDHRKATWLSRLRQSQIFVLHHDDSFKATIENLKINVAAQPISLPFKDCFFTFHNAEAIGVRFPDWPVFVPHFCQVTHETSSGTYETLALINNEGRFSLIDSKFPLTEIDPFTALFCTKLNAVKQVGVERWPLITKVKKYGIQRIVHESLIYISDKPKSMRSSISEHSEIEWQTKWWVRGHWVQISPQSLGKDRSGKRCVFGRTWRTEHQRGNPDGIEKQQTRIIRSEKSCLE